MPTYQPQQPPKPAPAPDPDTLPRPLTIFLTVAEHRAVTRALRALHKDRARAILHALRITPKSENSR